MDFKKLTEIFNIHIQNKAHDDEYSYNLCF